MEVEEAVSEFKSHISALLDEFEPIPRRLDNWVALRVKASEKWNRENQAKINELLIELPEGLHKISLNDIDPVHKIHNIMFNARLDKATPTEFNDAGE